MLTISDLERTIVLETRRNAIDLELKLNKSQFGHKWNYIGDVLYEWGSSQLGAQDYYVVSPEQLTYLNILLTESN